jgi:hypothetical protein
MVMHLDDSGGSLENEGRRCLELPDVTEPESERPLYHRQEIVRIFAISVMT